VEFTIVQNLVVDGRYLSQRQGRAAPREPSDINEISSSPCEPWPSIFHAENIGEHPCVSAIPIGKRTNLRDELAVKSNRDFIHFEIQAWRYCAFGDPDFGY
jgi:hypothetical protein